MVEQERLELTSAVEEEGHNRLDELADKLDEVDNSLQRAGSNSDDEVFIDIDFDDDALVSALGKLEALDERLESIDDADVSIDGPAMGGGTAMATSGGFPGFPDDYEPDNEEKVTGRGDIFASRNHPSLNKPSFDDVMNVDKKLITSANPETPFDGPFGVGTGVADDGRIRELINVLEDNTEQFSPFDVGEHDGGSTIQMERNVGLAAEGIDADIGSELIAAQRKAMDAMGDDNDDFRNKLKELKIGIRDLQFTMGTFHQIIASVIPFLGVFVGAMPAAITGVVALGGAALAAAGALAAVGGLGLLGLSLQGQAGVTMGPIQDALNQLKNSFLDAFAPLAREFAPVIENTITELDMMMGPLSSAAGALTQFRNIFMDMAGGLTDTLPSLVSDTLAFSQAAMPVLSGVATFIMGKDLLGFLANQLALALRELFALGTALVEILPAIVRISQGFLQFASMLALPIHAISILINTFPILGQVLGMVGAAFLTFIGISTLYTAATAEATLATIGFMKSLAGTALAAMTKAAVALKPLILQLHAYTISALGAYWGTVALVSALTLGIGVVGILAGQFAALGGNIKDATKNLKQFSNRKNALGSTSFNSGTSTGGGYGSAYRDNSTTIIQAGPDNSTVPVTNANNTSITSLESDVNK